MALITALAGGVGAAKFLEGLVKVVPEEDLVIVGNVGDDVEFYGLHVSPDLDIVAYTLAGIVDEEKGWGVRGDTFNLQAMLALYGLEAWFKLGDKDLATHIYRTHLLRSGVRLSEVTRRICGALGLKVKLIPVSDDPVRTVVETPEGELLFQEYFVKRRAMDRVLKVRFEGAEKARPAPGVIESIMDSEAIILCPSNPIVSIGGILAVPGIRQSLIETSATVAAISPIVGGKALKGPADKMMVDLGLEASAHAVAELYSDFLDLFVIDYVDSGLKRRIEETLGIDVFITNTVMVTLEDKVRLARDVLKALPQRRDLI